MPEKVYALFDNDFPPDLLSVHKSIDGALQAAGELLDDGQECYLEDHPHLGDTNYVIVAGERMCHINEMELKP